MSDRPIDFGKPKEIPMFVATTCYDDNEVSYWNEGENPLLALSEFSKHDFLTYCDDNAISDGEEVTVYMWTTIAFENSEWASDEDWQEGDDKPFDWCLDDLVRTAYLKKDGENIIMRIPPITPLSN